MTGGAEDATGSVRQEPLGLSLMTIGATVGAITDLLQELPPGDVHEQFDRLGTASQPGRAARRSCATAHIPAACASDCGNEATSPGPGAERRGTAAGTTCWLTHRMGAPLPEPDPAIDPDQPVPDDPGELLPGAPEPLPPPPIEATPDDPGGDPGGVPEPA